MLSRILIFYYCSQITLIGLFDLLLPVDSQPAPVVIDPNPNDLTDSVGGNNA